MRILIGSVIGVVVGYCALSFALWDLNTANWNVESRSVLAFFVSPMLAFTGAFIGDHWK